SRGDGSFAPSIFNGYYALGTTVADPGLDLNRFRFADFNGDGCTDFLLLRGRGGSPMTSEVRLSRCDGTFAPPTGAGPARPVGATALLASIDLARIKLADFNGDGLVDIAAVEGYNDEYVPMSIYLSNGDGSFQAAIAGPPRRVNTLAADIGKADVNRVLVGDFDGDGRADIAGVDGPSPCPPIKVYLARGDGSFRVPPVSGPPFCVSSTSSAAHAMRDLDRI